MEDYYKLIFVEKVMYVKKTIIRTIPYFDAMIKGCEHDFEEITVDRMGFMFDHVLAYIVSPLYPYPAKYYDELDYYDICYDKQKLFDKHKPQLDIIENITRNNHVNTVFTTLTCKQCDQNTINRTYIVCKNHKYKVICQQATMHCGESSTEYNYCKAHCTYDVYNSNNLMCKKLGCGLHRIQDKYYCYLHNKKE